MSAEKDNRAPSADAEPQTDAAADLMVDEAYEAELAEQARQNGGHWDSAAPGKADNFGPNFLRMIGLLKPSAVWFVIVSIFGTIGVVLAVAAPKVLGEATNIVYEGFISRMLGTGIGDFPDFPRECRSRRSWTRCVRQVKTTSPTWFRQCRTSPSVPEWTSNGCAGSSWRC